MSEGWFDRAYRSDETPPPELDARILAAARRATRRWTIPAFAAASLTVAAVAILGFLITGHELHVPTADRDAVDSAGGTEGLQVDIVPHPPTSDPTDDLLFCDFAVPVAEPNSGPSPAPWAEGTAAQAPNANMPEFNCVRSTLIGPLGGPGRRDLVQVCAGEGSVRIKIVWDGEPPCPSTLEVQTHAEPSVVVDGPDLLVAKARYRCRDGQWDRVNGPLLTTQPLERPDEDAPAEGSAESPPKT